MRSYSFGDTWNTHWRTATYWHCLIPAMKGVGHNAVGLCRWWNLKAWPYCNNSSHTLTTMVNCHSASCKVFTEVQLRIPVFWDVTMCNWVSGLWCFRGTSLHSSWRAEGKLTEPLLASNERLSQDSPPCCQFKICQCDIQLNTVTYHYFQEKNTSYAADSSSTSQEIPSIYGIWTFTTTLTTAHQLSLPQAS